MEEGGGGETAVAAGVRVVLLVPRRGVVDDDDDGDAAEEEEEAAAAAWALARARGWAAWATAAATRGLAMLMAVRVRCRKRRFSTVSSSILCPMCCPWLAVAGRALAESWLRSWATCAGVRSGEPSRLLMRMEEPGDVAGELGPRNSSAPFLAKVRKLSMHESRIAVAVQSWWSLFFFACFAFDFALVACFRLAELLLLVALAPLACRLRPHGTYSSSSPSSPSSSASASQPLQWPLLLAGPGLGSLLYQWRLRKV